MVDFFHLCQRPRWRANRGGNRGIAKAVLAQVVEVQLDSVFDFALAEVVQPGVPMSIRAQVLRDALRDEDVARVATIENALREVNPGPGKIGAVIHVLHFLDRAAVRAHAQLHLRVSLAGLADFKGALQRVLPRYRRRADAIPSPVGSRINFPFASAERK